MRTAAIATVSGTVSALLTAGWPLAVLATVTLAAFCWIVASAARTDRLATLIHAVRSNATIDPRTARQRSRHSDRPE